MAARQPFGRPNLAYLKVELDLGTGNWNGTPTYTDVTDDLRFDAGITWERGRPDKFQSVSPGSIAFTLNNRPRGYDVFTNANLVPGRPGRLTCYYPTTATAYEQMYFSTEDFTPAYTPGGDAVVRVTGMERWGMLGFCPIVANVMLATTDCRVRLGQLADLAGWPAAARAFAAGLYPLSSQAYQQTTVLEAMQGVASGQAQVLYQTRDGNLKTAGMFNVVSGSGKTIGDGGGTELPFVDIEAGVGGGYWYTQVVLTAGGDAWISGQPNTVTKNLAAPYAPAKSGTRPFARTIAAAAKTSAQSACDSLATSLQNLDTYRVASVTINPLIDPASLFPVVLASDLGTSYTFRFQPPGGGTRPSVLGVARGIKHEVNQRGWLTTWTPGPT